MSFAPNTLIASDRGLVPVAELTGGFGAYDGTDYKPATAHAVPPEPLAQTLLVNGLTINTSASQALLVAPSSVEAPLWRPQHEIKTGDRVLMPYARYDTPLDPDALYVGQDFGGWSPSARLAGDIELWRMLGFALADGYYPDDLPSKDGFRVFAQDRRDMVLLARFERVCRHYEIDALRTYGEHPMLCVHHGPFQRWLRALGFRSMSEGVRFVPPKLFQAPAWIREAVLSGFFSCWGEWAEHSVKGIRTPHVYIPDPQLCQSMLRLLWSVGIAAAIEQRGWARKGDIFIRDLGRFQEQVHFLQERKRIPWVEREARRAGTWDTLRHETTIYLCRYLSEQPGWADLAQAQREKLTRHRHDGSGVRRTVAIQLCRAIGVEVPEWLRYHHAPVDACRTVTESALLYALQTQPHERQFIAGLVACR